MTHPTDDSLKPCPFCGGAAALHPRTCDKDTPYNPADRAFPVARCGQCGAEAVGKDWGRPETAAEKWNARAALLAEQARPVQETDRDWSEAQDWKGMDGAIAWHLIHRHADGWGDIGAMMSAWLAANATPPLTHNPIQEVYQKLHAGKVGAHWLWVVIEQIAAGIPEADAMREFGYYAQQQDHSAEPSNMVAEDAPSDELPMQPIVWAMGGVIRFKENRLVSKLLEHSRAHGFGLNELAVEDATEEERMQLAQLIGYSVSGYGGLSYVTDESADKSQDIADAMIAAAQAGAQEPKP